MSQSKKIIVAPLGWGLGHATRCIPIIRELQRQGAEVLLASDDRALALLRLEFPELSSFELPSYNVHYRTQNMVVNIAAQLPKILLAIWREHRAVKRLIKSQGVDGVISDNRFGCFSSKKYCVFLTHQVNILAPFFLLKICINFFNRLIIKRFNECWVPDLAHSPNLSGELSHPLHPFLKRKTKYIGALSRMEPGQSKAGHYAAIAVLSGPEPQRTQFEKALLEQAGQLDGSLLLVRGIPDGNPSPEPFCPKNTTIVASMTAVELNKAILDSSVFIGRSGYSTVMDLAALGKPALLVPTPGQTEQEYLADKFSGENIFSCQKQSELKLAVGMQDAQKRSGLIGSFFDEKALRVAITSFLQAC